MKLIADVTISKGNMTKIERKIVSNLCLLAWDNNYTIFIGSRNEKCIILVDESANINAEFHIDISHSLVHEKKYSTNQSMFVNKVIEELNNI